ncbi:MAG: hypothetical protein MJZ73_04655 [Bacteroidaceae bacterium]|nr:hypothetical protein [Bacteroidaceae bacterium]
MKTQESMKRENNISVALVGLKEYGLPFVEGAFQGDNGLWYKGYFLVDSCSVDCILSKKVLEVAAGSLTGGKCKKIAALGDEVIFCKPAHLNFAVGDTKFEETFYLGETIDFESTMEFSCVIGILGLKFLLRNGLAIDFERMTLHTSTVKEDNVNTETCRYLFPLDYGFQMFQTPMVGVLGKDEQEFVFLADTGANMNTITRRALEVGGFEHAGDGEKGHVVAFTGTFDVQFEDVKFKLASIGKSEEEINFQEHEKQFQVFDGQDYLLPSDDEEKPLVGGILGSGFMFQEGWILDFSSNVIYARKAV